MGALPSLSGGSAETFRVEVAADWATAKPAWEAAFRAGVATPFQASSFMEAWYRTLGGMAETEPLIVGVRDARTGEDVIQLALVRRKLGRQRVIGFADLDLVDYNAPILGPAAPREEAGARALLHDILTALPPADILDWTKMPPLIRGVTNPLALLPNLPSRLNGNLVEIGESFEDYTRGQLKRVVRKELERSWRVFSRHPEAHLVEAREPAKRNVLLQMLERMQPERLEATGRTSVISLPEPIEFYRSLVADDPTGERVGLFGLCAGEEVVAVLMGLHSPQRFTMIRIGNSLDDAWSNSSPGRLVIIRTMEHLHRQGVREFDFSVGNFDYKRRFAVQPTPLVDVVRALTPRGVPTQFKAQARAWLRARPELEDRARRLFGRGQPARTK